jgi:hypothetical protein
VILTVLFMCAFSFAYAGCAVMTTAAGRNGWPRDLFPCG